MERETRYWVEALAGPKQEALFEHGVVTVWTWANPARLIPWFTDGERRYGQALWKLASVVSRRDPCPVQTALSVASGVISPHEDSCGSQGQRRIESVNTEHPFTAISPVSEVHAHHHEAQNSALPPGASAYRRRQNLYAQRLESLQRALDVQRLIHNWTRPHWGLGSQTTPAMAMGYCNRPISIHELLTKPGVHCITC